MGTGEGEYGTFFFSIPRDLFFFILLNLTFMEPLIFIFSGSSYSLLAKLEITREYIKK